MAVSAVNSDNTRATNLLNSTRELANQLAIGADSIVEKLNTLEQIEEVTASIQLLNDLSENLRALSEKMTQVSAEVFAKLSPEVLKGIEEGVQGYQLANGHLPRLTLPMLDKVKEGDFASITVEQPVEDGPDASPSEFIEAFHCGSQAFTALAGGIVTAAEQGIALQPEHLGFLAELAVSAEGDY